MNETLKDSILLLVGHGSTIDAQASEVVKECVRIFQESKRFLEVSEAYWIVEPRLSEVLANIDHAHIIVMPMLTCSGYFSEQRIPIELGLKKHPDEAFERSQVIGDRQITYCRPVGEHHGMARILQNQAEKVIERYPFPAIPNPEKTSLFIVAHGTKKDSNSRKTAEKLVISLKHQSTFGQVQALFLDESPGVEEYIDMASYSNIVVVPFFIGGGPHTTTDIPILMGESERTVKKRLNAGQPPWRNPCSRRGKRIWYAECFGVHPEIPSMILDQIEDAIPRFDSG
ncbi:MAG TPA: hypothetical protein EYQ50_21915 [Verrucomicrobiales bacterium]|nr:hypothetical protein [Verrucomicrobiales bacterium]HIL70954.1 hypothetical protein [Verrucomicrobiota bacterium]